MRIIFAALKKINDWWTSLFAAKLEESDVKLKESRDKIEQLQSQCTILSITQFSFFLNKFSCYLCVCLSVCMYDRWFFKMFILCSIPVYVKT